MSLVVPTARCWLCFRRLRPTAATGQTNVVVFGILARRHRRCHSPLLPLPSCCVDQKSIEEFLTQAKNPGDDQHMRLFNPLSAEFGVKTDADAQYLVDDVLPRFKLVSVFPRVRVLKAACIVGYGWCVSACSR